MGGDRRRDREGSGSAVTEELEAHRWSGVRDRGDPGSGLGDKATPPGGVSDWAVMLVVITGPLPYPFQQLWSVIWKRFYTVHSLDLNRV